MSVLPQDEFQSLLQTLHGGSSRRASGASSAERYALSAAVFRCSYLERWGESRLALCMHHSPLRARRQGIAAEGSVAADTKDVFRARCALSVICLFRLLEPVKSFGSKPTKRGWSSIGRQDKSQIQPSWTSPIGSLADKRQASLQLALETLGSTVHSARPRLSAKPTSTASEFRYGAARCGYGVTILLRAASTTRWLVESHLCRAQRERVDYWYSIH
jgi:hypothetical protein